MKTFELMGKLLLTNDTTLSIQNTYANKAFPYWVSNPTGITIKKLKLMAGRSICSVEGGSLTVNLFKISSISEPVKADNNNVLTVNEIEDKWEHIGSIDYSAKSNTDILYPTDYKIVDINIPEQSYIIGTVKVTEGLQIKDLFVWIDYENNPL